MKSDRRIVQNIADLSGCVAKIQATRPRQCQFIDDPSLTFPCFIPQEFITPFPDNVMVNGDDGNVPLGSNFPWEVDDEVLTPWLAGAVIELKGLIDAQQTLIESLQSRIAALEII